MVGSLGLVLGQTPPELTGDEQCDLGTPGELLQTTVKSDKGSGQFLQGAGMACGLIGMGVVATLGKLQGRWWGFRADEAQGQADLLAKGTGGQGNALGPGSQGRQQALQLLFTDGLDLEHLPQGRIGPSPGRQQQVGCTGHQGPWPDLKTGGTAAFEGTGARGAKGHEGPAGTTTVGDGGEPTGAGP